MTQSPSDTLTVMPLTSKPPFVSTMFPSPSARKLQLSVLVQPCVVFSAQMRMRSCASLFFT